MQAQFFYAPQFSAQVGYAGFGTPTFSIQPLGQVIDQYARPPTSAIYRDCSWCKGRRGVHAGWCRYAFAPYEKKGGFGALAEEVECELCGGPCMYFP